MASLVPKFKRFIESITITNPGSDYSSLSGDIQVLISAPSGSPDSEQVQATATAAIQNGRIDSVTITEGGDGYLDIPEINIVSGVGIGTESLTNTTTADSRRQAGTYPNVAVVSDRAGTGAFATVVVDSSGAVTSIEVTESGSLYSVGENVGVTDVSIGGVNNAPDMTFIVAQNIGGGNGAILTPTLQTIARSSSYFHDNMSYLIESQIPDFVKTDYPNFSKFIKDYYSYLDLGPEALGALNLVDGETNQAPNHLLQELIDKLNVDHSLNEEQDFLQPLLEQYAIDFPSTADIDSRLLIKNIRSFFESKGSRKGVEEFFKMMFNEEVEIFLPSEFILRPSDGIYDTELAVKVYANEEILPVPDPLNLTGKRVDIHYYESIASITTKKIISTSVSRVKKISYTFPDVYEMTLDLPGKTEIPGQGVEGELVAVIGGKIATIDTVSEADALRIAGTYDINSGFTTNGNGTGAEFTVVVDGSGAATVTVDTSGDDYAPEETVTIPDSLLGNGGAADLEFDVATITDGKIFSVTIADGGAGYSANPKVIVQPNPNDTITSNAVIDTRLSEGSITNTVFLNNAKGDGYNNVPTLILNTDSVRSWVGIEGLPDNIANKTAFLTRVLNSVSLKTNSGASDGGFLVGETFKVSESGDILGVYAIDYFAEDYTLTGIDNNAIVRIKSLDDNNYPSVVEVISTGTGFQRSFFEFVLRSSSNETATIDCFTGFSHTYPGSFKNSRGFLSDANKIQDNAIYQNFSYQVRTSRPKTEWGELLDRIAHPAGMIAWTDLQINQKIDMGAGFDAVPDVFVFRLFIDIETSFVQDAPALFFHKPTITDSVNWADSRTGTAGDTILLFPNLGKFETPVFDDQVNLFDITKGEEDSVGLPEFEAGANELTNSTFDSDLSGWGGALGDFAWRTGGGAERINGTSNSAITQSGMSLIEGEWYQLDVDVFWSSGADKVTFYMSDGGANYGIAYRNGTGHLTATFKATATTTKDFRVSFLNDFRGYITNASFKHLNSIVAKETHKPSIEDSVDLSEIVDILFFVARTPTESVDWTHVITKLIGIAQEDSVGVSKDVSLGAGVSVPESIDWVETVSKAAGTAAEEDPVVDETTALLVGSDYSDDTGWGESGFIVAQNYTSGNYFAEDYVGEVRIIFQNLIYDYSFEKAGESGGFLADSGFPGEAGKFDVVGTTNGVSPREGNYMVKMTAAGATDDFANLGTFDIAKVLVGGRIETVDTISAADSSRTAGTYSITHDEAGDNLFTNSSLDYPPSLS